jgi:hypothetical protein
MGEPTTMREWRQSRSLSYRFRWWLFCRLNTVVWAICPEPDATVLREYMDLSKDQRAALLKASPGGTKDAG